jgi:hypothetical protein
VSTREPDRDRTIEEMLRRSASRGGGSASDRHLDAETLAAWIDGDLSAADVSAAEAHVSSCGRCQAMVAAIVRTTPSTPALVPWWRRGWAIGALVPLTAGVAAIAIWVATPDVALNKAPATVTGQTPAAPVVAPPQEPRQEPGQIPQRTLSSEPVASPPASARERVASESAAKSDAPASVDALKKKVGERDELKEAAANELRRDQVAGAAALAPAAPPPAAATPGAASSNAAAREAQSDATARDAAAPRREIAMARSAFMSPPAEIIAPDQTVRWRPGASGSIQRSTDGGATWTTLVSGVSDDLTAGSAPSSTICWIVGRHGTVLLTADGREWRRVAFPEPVDLLAIQAVDLVNATVTTADGRRFRTGDGGQTWSPSGPFQLKR